jgi:hypothetical protein
MPKTTNTSPGVLNTQMQEMIDGLATPPAGLTSLAILGVTYAMPEVAQKLGDFHATYDAADAAEVKYNEALQTRALIAPDAEKFVSATRGALKAALGRQAPGLKQFGIEPEKAPAPATTEQKVERVAKAKATRIARHTLGKKAKSKIKGTPPASPPAGP